MKNLNWNFEKSRKEEITIIQLLKFDFLGSVFKPHGRNLHRYCSSKLLNFMLSGLFNLKLVLFVWSYQLHVMPSHWALERLYIMITATKSTKSCFYAMRSNHFLSDSLAFTLLSFPNGVTWSRKSPSRLLAPLALYCKSYENLSWNTVILRYQLSIYYFDNIGFLATLQSLLTFYCPFIAYFYIKEQPPQMSLWIPSAFFCLGGVYLIIRPHESGFSSNDLLGCILCAIAILLHGL